MVENKKKKKAKVSTANHVVKADDGPQDESKCRSVPHFSVLTKFWPLSFLKATLFSE